MSWPGPIYYMPHMTLEGLWAAYDEYNRVIRHVAKETGAVLIDGENRIPGDDTHFIDSVHFSDAGSARMAERVAQRLISAPALLAGLAGT